MIEMIILWCLGSWTVLCAIPVVCLYLYFPGLRYELIYIRKLVNFLLLRLKSDRSRSYCMDILEDNFKKKTNKIALGFHDEQFTYGQIEQRSNKVAHMARDMGLEKGDTVALLLHNEPAFVWTVFGLMRLGVKPALLNFDLRGDALMSCVTLSQAKTLIVGKGHDLLAAVDDLRDELQSRDMKILVQGEHATRNGFESFDEMYNSAPSTPVERAYREPVNKMDVALMTFKSCPTGSPRIASTTVDTLVQSSLYFPSMLNLTESDTFYVCLPHYHGGGPINGVFSAMCVGAKVVFREKFSAAHFWDDCVRHKVTTIVYDEQLCKNLLTSPQSPDDNKHNVRKAFGQGLRSDIWREFQDRFAIPRIYEFYGVAEGNFALVNLVNKVGSVGRLSPLMQTLGMPMSFIACDPATGEPSRGPGGLCRRVKSGTPGLAITSLTKRISHDRLKGNRGDTDQRILTDVFVKGDVYLNTGDILIRDKDYFVYSCDRR